MAKNDKPVMDSGELPGPRPAPYHAGGPQGSLAGRKTALLGTGRPGFVPGHEGKGRGSSLRAGYVHEAPVSGPSGHHPDDPELLYSTERRPMPRETPVSSTPGHTGSYVRFLDGHTEVHRERPALVEDLNDPHMADYHDEIRTEIADRDEIHKHEWW